MQIELTTDHNLEGGDRLTEKVEGHVEAALDRFLDRLTRVEVHLGDESAGRPTGADIRCTVEARPARLKPVAVTHHAADVDGACRGALKKLATLLDSHFGRQDSHKGGASIRHPEA